MVIDTLKCVGCSDCVVACQTENNVPVGYCRDWITEVVDGSYPNVELELKSERCNHCENAPCVRCCPTGASHIIDGGIVLVTPEECIGCGACKKVCPVECISGQVKEAHVIDESACIACGACFDKCKFDAVVKP